MNDADISRLWDEHKSGLMRVRWDQTDPAGMVDFTTLEPVAMPGTITHAADDVDHIRQRLKEIADERAEVKRNSDPGVAAGEYLDNIAKSWSLVRTSGESDYSFRQRITKAAGGDS